MKRYLKYLALLCALCLVTGVVTACQQPPEEPKPTLCFRIAVQADPDGWVYAFDNQYLVGDVDYGSGVEGRVPFTFTGVNLRYRYNENYTKVIQTQDALGNTVNKTVLLSTLLRGDSSLEEEQRDMAKISAYLNYDRKGTSLTTAELMALTPEELGFECIDGEMFLRLMRECLTSESIPLGAYPSLPSYALLTEPVYLDDYKIQVGIKGSFGAVAVIMLDVLYRTGEELTDYVQLYDLVRDGEASEEQIQLLDTLQSIESGIVQNNDLQYGEKEYGDAVIAGVSLDRLYEMLENIEKNEYMQYVVYPQ